MRRAPPASSLSLRDFRDLSGQPLTHKAPALVFRPVLLLEQLVMLPPGIERLKLGTLLARIWARRDINAAWQAIGQSRLSAEETQAMLNELWG